MTVHERRHLDELADACMHARMLFLTFMLVPAFLAALVFAIWDDLGDGRELLAAWVAVAFAWCAGQGLLMAWSDLEDELESATRRFARALRAEAAAEARRG